MVSISEVINNQYPHFLYTRASGEGVQNETGGWTGGEAVYEYHSRCREETNGRGTKVATADGTYRVFSALVQIPVDAARIPEGTEVIITDEDIDPAQLHNDDFVSNATNNIIRIKGECLKFDKGRLHNRLWI